MRGSQLQRDLLASHWISVPGSSSPNRATYVGEKRPPALEAPGSLAMETKISEGERWTCTVWLILCVQDAL